MLPIKKTGDALALRQQTWQNDKIALLSNVSKKLNSVDLMVCQAGAEVAIRNLEDADFIPKIATACKFICRDVGIRDWNNAEVMKYDALRFFQTIKRHYKDYTLEEIKLAFELAQIGELDEWLPKDRNGHADKNHYQAFSMEYYCKILNAYRRKKGISWHKARTALPAASVEITEEQKAENQKIFIQDIYDSFYAYKNDGINPNFALSIFINEFIAQGLIDQKPKPAELTINRAYTRILLSELPRQQKEAVKQNFSINKPSGMLLVEAQLSENNIAIRKIYDDLIENGTDIKTVIK